MGVNPDWRDKPLNQATRRLINKAANAKLQEERRAAYNEGRSQRKGLRVASTELTKLTNRVQRQQAVAPLNLDLLTDQQLQELATALLREEKYDWRGANARPEQIKPEDYTIWLLLAGRGWGKTRAMTEAIREYCETPNIRVAVVAKDHRQLRDVLLEGVSGIIACFPPEEIKKVHKGLGDVSVDLVNGSSIKMYTAGEPDAVRGQSFDVIVGDEFAAWPKNKAQEMLDMLRMCQRESKSGSVVILGTTPKRIPHVMDILKLAEDPDEKVVIARGSSRDNTTLTEEWHRQMERRFGGTRLGRQELGGEMVMDNEFALWTGRMIDEARYEDDEEPTLVGVVTGVDPSGSSDGDETGIVTAGWDKQKRIHVLENKSTGGEPGVRYRAVCLSAFEHGAGRIVVEWAYGGDNAAFGIENAWKDCQREGLVPLDRPCPPIEKSTMKGDKAARAMPVVALYEAQMNRPDLGRRIFHPAPSGSNGMAKLEDQMLMWDTTDKKSPNDIDALVHCVRGIMRKLGLETTIASPASPFSTRRVNRGFNPYGR